MKHKSLLVLIAASTILFPLSANAQQIKDSINHLLSEKQLAEFCDYSGKSGNTRIKIRLPNGMDVWGTVSCRADD